ncbi:MAG: hypothetical protein NVV74_01970 [Magnetospirillum sp.]|nr:hypothetical protein [Magnetospirillum sp.]
MSDLKELLSSLDGLIAEGYGIAAPLVEKNAEFLAANAKAIDTAQHAVLSLSHTRMQELKSVVATGNKFGELFKSFVITPSLFQSETRYRLFLAAVLAEHYWAQAFASGRETDLNGEVFSMLAHASRDVDDSMPPLAKKGDIFKVAYAPVAGVEDVEGGEIALIVHGHFGASGEAYRPVLFQAKRSEGGASHRVDIRRQSGDTQQLFKLLDNGHGYYLVYNQAEIAALWNGAPRKVIAGPTVMSSVAAMRKILPEISRPIDQWKTIIPSMDADSLMFSTFLCFHMFNQRNNIPTYEKPEDALAAIMGEKAPSRLAYVAGGEKLNVARFLTVVRDSNLIDPAQLLGNVTAADFQAAQPRSPGGKKP